MTKRVVCPQFGQALDLLGKRWTGIIIDVLLNGPMRFSDIRRAIPQLSDRVLTERLRELETAGLVQRDIETTAPVRVIYRLTPAGCGLRPVLRSLHQWVDEYLFPWKPVEQAPPILDKEIKSAAKFSAIKGKS
ncbi:MAG: helix-turn-helix domain-containing protein [Firmicutes bacterium]|nr:helix-turn-helix domain-containing protein [Bacillota bacterium]